MKEPCSSAKFNLGNAGKMSQYFINFAANIPQNRPMNELISL